MSHTCHAAGCSQVVPPQMFMCRKHWYTLTADLRRAVWRTYRVGQCDDKMISQRYADAAVQSIKFVAEKEGMEVSDDSPEIALYRVHVTQE